MSFRLRPNGAGQDEEWTATLPSSRADLEALFATAAAQRVPGASLILDETGCEAEWLDLEAGELYYVSAGERFAHPGSTRQRVGAGGAAAGIDASQAVERQAQLRRQAADAERLADAVAGEDDAALTAAIEAARAAGIDASQAVERQAQLRRQVAAAQQLAAAVAGEDDASQAVERQAQSGETGGGESGGAGAEAFAKAIRRHRDDAALRAETALVARPTTFEHFVQYGDRTVLDGPTLANGRVCIRGSSSGGAGGRGLFCGAGRLPKGTEVLYSGTLISKAEAQELKARGKAGYIAQLGAHGCVNGQVLADAIATEPNAEGLFVAREDWANASGPGCMVNEDRRAPNSVFDMKYFGRDRLQAFRVLRLTRDVEPGEELLMRYGSDTVGSDGEEGAACEPSSPRWEWQSLPRIAEQKRIGRETKAAIAMVFERRAEEWAKRFPGDGKDDEVTAFCEHFGIKHTQMRCQVLVLRSALTPTRRAAAAPSFRSSHKRAPLSRAAARTATPGSTSADSSAPNDSAAAATPAPLPPRAWLHHEVHEALLKLVGRSDVHELQGSSAAIEAAELLAAVRAAAAEGSEPVTDEEGQDAIATMGERGWVVLSAAAEAGEAMEVEGDECSAALVTLRARGWLVGSSSEQECIASLVARGAAEGSEAAEVSAEEASAAVRTLCAARRCFVRDSTPREWAKFVFELRRREQDKAVELLTEEVDDVDAWRSRLEEMAGRGGKVGERVSGRIEEPEYGGRPYVSREWPRALLDAPCAWGKTVGSIKVAVELFHKHGEDLGTVAVFEHRLDLIKQVMEEWKKWAEFLGVELEMFTVCSVTLGLAGEGDEDGRPVAKRARTSASSSTGGGGAASGEWGGEEGEEDEEEEKEAAGDEQRDRADPDAIAAEKKMGATRLQDAAAVKQRLGTPPPSGKLRVLFVCYDSTFLLRDAYDVNGGGVPEPLGLAIFDEAHEMAAGRDDSKEHLHALALYDKNVPIRRRLFMTATPKVAMVKQASDDAKEEGESLALSMGEEEMYGSEHVEQCDESGRRDIVRGRRYSMRFDEAITRGLITDYKLLVISGDGKREEIESLAKARLSTADGSPFAEQLAEWKRRHASFDWPTGRESRPEVDALEVAKVKALEDALVHQGLQKVFVFSSLRQWAELFGILATELIVDKSRRETSSDAEAAPPPLLVRDKVHVVHSSAEYRAHEGFKKRDAASARAKREGSGYDAVKEFGASAPPAVLSNVRSLVTGTDCPRADGTMFGTTKGNSIGVVQQAGHSFRLDLPTFGVSGTLVHAGNKTKVAKVLMCIFEGEVDPAAIGKAPTPSTAVKRGRKAGEHPSSSGGDRGSVMNVLKAFQGVDTRMDGLVRSAHRVLINGRERALTDVLSLARLGERMEIMGMDEAQKIELTTSVLDACVPIPTGCLLSEAGRRVAELNRTQTRDSLRRMLNDKYGINLSSQKYASQLGHHGPRKTDYIDFIVEQEFPGCGYSAYRRSLPQEKETPSWWDPLAPPYPRDCIRKHGLAKHQPPLLFEDTDMTFDEARRVFNEHELFDKSNWDSSFYKGAELGNLISAYKKYFNGDFVGDRWRALDAGGIGSSEVAASLSLLSALGVHRNHVDEALRALEAEVEEQRQAEPGWQLTKKHEMPSPWVAGERWVTAGAWVAERRSNGQRSQSARAKMSPDQLQRLDKLPFGEMSTDAALDALEAEVARRQAAEPGWRLPANHEMAAPWGDPKWKAGSWVSFRSGSCPQSCSARAKMTEEQRRRLGELPYGEAFTTDDALDALEAEVARQRQETPGWWMPARHTMAAPWGDPTWKAGSWVAKRSGAGEAERKRRAKLSEQQRRRLDKLPRRGEGAPPTAKKRKGNEEEAVPVAVLKMRVKGLGHQYFCTLEGGGEAWLPAKLLRESYAELLEAFNPAVGDAGMQDAAEGAPEPFGDFLQAFNV